MVKVYIAPHGGLKVYSITARPPPASLPAGSQASSQPLRQVCGQYSFLCLLQVVGHTAEDDHVGARIEYGERGAPVAIARLAHRAWIDQVTHVFLEREFDGLRLSQCVVLRPKVVVGYVVCGKTSLQVGVSKECQRCGGSQQRFDGIAQGYYVLVFVDWRAMHKLYTGEFGDLQRAFRQGSQPFQVFGSKLFTSP